MSKTEITIKIDGQKIRTIYIHGKVVKKYNVETAKKIGLFYLDKHMGDYEKAEEEARRTGIQELEETDDTLTIYTSRPGAMIGKRGENLDKLEVYLGKKIKIVEVESVMDNIVPCPDEPDFIDWGRSYLDE